MKATKKNAPENDIRLATQAVLEANGKRYKYYSIPLLEKEGYDVRRLPRSLRIILESMVRNLDGSSITLEDVEKLLRWRPGNPQGEMAFKVARVVTQDFTGTSLILDLAVMREYVSKVGLDPATVNPQVPVDLIIDHSVQVDFWSSPDALRKNIELEFQRNAERYRLFKWAANYFKNFRVFPPGIGIIHQVNLEYLSKVVIPEEQPGGYVAYFDTVIGTDSHTPMVNGLGVLGWGVGGVEAEAAMMGLPVVIPLPEVVGVHLYGSLREGVTATDLVLTVTELLRKRNVVGKFVEFFGEGVAELSVPDRATVANMAPEYGSTTALFPVDEETLRYLRLTGRPEDHVALVRKYFEAQGMFGSQAGEEYSEVIELDLSTVEPSIAGPLLPWQRLRLQDVPTSLAKFVEERRKRPGLLSTRIALDGQEIELRDGDVVIAAITSCTNTSNPEVMIGAGLIAKKAVELGLKVPLHVKTSMAPGSRVVTEYLSRSGLLGYLEKLGFSVVGYGCTTCIGNSGPLPEAVSRALTKEGIYGVAVLSGNRNFEGRVHPDVRASYLMSPMTVVIYALAGTVNKDLSKEPVALSEKGPVYLKDLWPSREEIRRIIDDHVRPGMFVEKYSKIYEDAPEAWKKLEAPSGALYEWDARSTYIKRPPFLDDFDPEREPVLEDIVNARPLLILGDSVSTDHISPAGRIDPDSPAGKYLLEQGVSPKDFNTYGARRGNHEVMVRGAFASKGVRNKMLADKGVVGGYTIHHPSGEVVAVYDAAMRYSREGVPLIIIAGREYGLGSSRDWAARAPRLLGVRAVIAESFERIHRANLVGMGIIPLQFPEGISADKLGLRGDELYHMRGLRNLRPRGAVKLTVEKPSGEKLEVELIARVETAAEIIYLKHGGILNYAFKTMLEKLKNPKTQQ